MNSDIFNLDTQDSWGHHLSCGDWVQLREEYRRYHYRDASAWALVGTVIGVAHQYVYVWFGEVQAEKPQVRKFSSEALLRNDERALVKAMSVSSPPKKLERLLGAWGRDMWFKVDGRIGVLWYQKYLWLGQQPPATKVLPLVLISASRIRSAKYA